MQSIRLTHEAGFRDAPSILSSIVRELTEANVESFIRIEIAGTDDDAREVVAKVQLTLPMFVRFCDEHKYNRSTVMGIGYAFYSVIRDRIAYTSCSELSSNGCELWPGVSVQYLSTGGLGTVEGFELGATPVICKDDSTPASYRSFAPTDLIVL